MGQYDEALIPLLANQLPQYGRQYWGPAVGPRLALLQPGTWPPQLPPPYMGTMKSTGHELLDFFTTSSPQAQEATMNPMMNMRSARRGERLRAGVYPTQNPPPAPTPFQKCVAQFCYDAKNVGKCIEEYCAWLKGAEPPGAAQPGGFLGRASRLKLALAQKRGRTTFAPGIGLTAPVCGPRQPCPAGMTCINGKCFTAPQCGPGDPCPRGQICINGKCVQSLRAQRVKRRKGRKRRRRNPRVLNQIGSAVVASVVGHAIRKVVFP